ncbi:hypothetical protein RHMOL_Rhmol02G0133700 [Rhododendron molle]|uniref:Uncharacterized protein n=1 Tax=Rhododendron molle TaxID=49168 RepID=A0ACC0PSS1_RHOML|nr:hypothetical protein RHMOL_Rhmol02G0133700 [Rhododendron molle]
MVVDFSSGANWCWLLMDRSLGFQSPKLYLELLHWLRQRIEAILTRFHRFCLASGSIDHSVKLYKFPGESLFLSSICCV